MRRGLHTVRQAVDETEASYATRVQHLMETDMVEIPELLLVDALKQGLLPKLRSIVVQMDPQTMVDFRRCAKIAENTAAAVASSQAATVCAADATSPDSPSVSQVLVLLADAVNELRANMMEQRDQPRSFGRPGPPTQPAWPQAPAHQPWPQAPAQQPW
jgi:hypothetical protein